LNIDPSKFINLLNASVFIDLYNRFLSMFPSSVHWLVSLIILVAIVFALISLIMGNWLFLILAIVLLPVLYPIFKNFFTEIYAFLVYLWNIVGNGLPKAP